MHDAIFDHLCSHTDVSMLEAPTGWGKTLGCISWMKRQRSSFCKCAIVFPTRSCIQRLPMVPNVSYYTSMEWMHHSNEHFDLLVIDECHTISREYQLMYRILNYLWKLKKISKLLFMTATLDETRMKNMFPTCLIRRVQDNHPRFHIETTYFYENYLVQSPQSHFHTVCKDLIEKWKILTSSHKRILIFVASHRQCEQLMQSLHDESLHDESRHRFMCYSSQMEDRNVCDYYLYKKIDEPICVIT
jgi:hypothetical protein